MDSIFKKPKLKAQNGRNAFDRSQKRVFHVPFGMLVPCFYQRVNPGDYVELGCESQFICDKIARPSFIRLKEHINYYYVPFEMLWMPFDNLLTAQDNYFSQAIESVQAGQKVPNEVPVMNSQFLWGMLCQLSTKADIHGFNKAVDALRLLDLLGYGNWYQTYIQNADASGVLDPGEGNKLNGLDPMNLFGLLAYQKVYYDYYRNPKYERNESKAYNIDDYEGSYVFNNQSVIDNFDRLEKIFETHYAWAKKDYFMDVQPTILPTGNDIGYDGLVSNEPGSSTSQNGLFDIFGVPGAAPINGFATVNDAFYAQSDAVQNFGKNVNTVSSGTTTPYNVTALRFAFAYDKLLRRMREAGGTFEAQMLAQFGIVAYDQRHGKCIYIGGQTNRLRCSDVVNTAYQNDGGSTKLGFLGANINQYSTPRGTFKYHCKDAGIIIGMYHTSLDFDYSSYGIQRDNLARTRFDWFNPAFENLGLQAIFRNELLSIQYQENDQYDIAVPETQNQHSVLGFVRRYSEYKTNVDRIYGLFDFGQSVDKNAWVCQYFPFKLQDGDQTEPVRIDPLNQRVMIFNPLTFNQVVTTNYNGMWNTDHFDCHQYHHFKVISNMSKVGEVF